MDTFENLIKRGCTSAADAKAKSFSGYFARDWNEFGFSYEILNFPHGKSHIGNGEYESKDILGFGTDGKRIKPWYSNSYEFRIVNTREEYVVFVQLNW